MLGHDGPPSGLWDKNLVTGEPLGRCPRRLLLEEDGSRELREVAHYRDEIFPLWQRNLLYFPGSVGEQPARYIAFMREFDHAKLAAQAAYDRISKEQGESADGEGGDVPGAGM